MFKFVWSDLVQTCKNFSNLNELFHTCMNFLNLCELFTNLYELFSNSYDLFWICPKSAWTCIKLYELVQIGLNLSELVQTCPKIIFRKPQKPTNFWWSQRRDTFMTEMDFLLILRKPKINLLLLPPQLMIMTQNIIFIGKTCEKNDLI